MPRPLYLFGLVGLLYLATGVFYSWNLALNILNVGLLSAIMALGVNMQWGYAGLFSTGIMGSLALGGLSVALVAGTPVPEGWAAGGPRLIGSLVAAVAMVAGIVLLYRRLPATRSRSWIMAAAMIAAFVVFRWLLDPAVAAVEANNPAFAGNIGGLGLNPLAAWPVGAVLAGLVAWVIGKICLGLREDYLAVATLGIAEIVVATMKNEDWLDRGVKNLNISSRPFPAPLEVDLQAAPWFQGWATSLGADPIILSTIAVKLIYAVMFGLVLLALIWASERALNSPWGRMMRAIRDNEIAAAAMGKNVTRRHLQIFIIGSAVVGLAGAMYTSFYAQLNPGEYSPLRFTFLVWVMVIAGGSGNNWGSVLGGLLIGWLWLIVEDLGPRLMQAVTSVMPAGPLQQHLVDSSAHLRLVALGAILLLVLRFAPRGLLPEK